MAKRPPPKASAKAAPRKIAAPRQDAPGIHDQLDRLTVPQLRAVAERAQALIKEKADSERQALIDDVTARAKDLGVSVKDLFGIRKAKAVRNAGGKRSAVPVKYQGPNPHDQWSGRGRPSKWLQALEAEGREPDEFLVASKAA